MGYLIERDQCPVCSSGQIRCILDLAFDEQPIKSYLDNFYGGRFDLTRIEGHRYLLELCDRCLLVFQRFVPGPELIDYLYGNAAEADREELSRERGLQIRQVYAHQVEQVEQVIKYWNRDPTKLHVLDFGSGTGIWLLMVEAYGCVPYAAELGSVRVGHLESRGIRVYRLSDLPERRFHFINAEQVFEHLVDPAQVIHQLCNALVPGGLLRIAVPNGIGIEARLADADWSAPKESHRSLNAVAPLEHVNCFKRESLLALGSRGGLREFTYPFRQYMTSMERVRFMASALVHLVRTPTGTSPIMFRRSNSI
jgi:SAM-dependent methyltransferase